MKRNPAMTANHIVNLYDTSLSPRDAVRLQRDIINAIIQAHKEEQEECAKYIEQLPLTDAPEWLMSLIVTAIRTKDTGFPL